MTVAGAGGEDHDSQGTEKLAKDRSTTSRTLSSPRRTRVMSQSGVRYLFECCPLRLWDRTPDVEVFHRVSPAHLIEQGFWRGELRSFMTCDDLRHDPGSWQSVACRPAPGQSIPMVVASILRGR